MSDITDELLDELESLEKNTEDLSAKVGDVKNTKKQLDHTPSAENISTTGLLLEACKSSQQAAQFSQETADINLRTAQKQQLQLDDMQEIALASRQAMRNANQEAKSSKSFVTALSISSILFVGGLAGASSWFLYSSQQTQQNLEQQIIDIIKTENTLNQRHLNLKINELASLIELSLADLKHPPQSFDLQFEIPEIPVEQNANNMLAPAKTSINPTDTVDLNHAIQSHQQTLLTALTQLQADLHRLQEQMPITQTTQKASPSTPDLSSLTPRFNRLENQIKTQTAEIKALQALITQRFHNQTTATPTSTTTAHTISTQDWSALKTQINTLSEQQKSMEKRLGQLSESMTNLKQESSAPPAHYQYRNPYQYSN
ncbi:hypothetical protein [Thiomicrospira microaerophila]|uniref:hypothetical protein n=1 Tax=Thiomicrospira microaerophila TaxID=406020 RepID=UPI0005C82013|nr:hypothetical protein [Thiomicrospira microaerophila]